MTAETNLAKHIKKLWHTVKMTLLHSCILQVALSQLSLETFGFPQNWCKSFGDGGATFSVLCIMCQTHLCPTVHLCEEHVWCMHIVRLRVTSVLLHDNCVFYVYDRWDPLEIWEVMLALLLMPWSFLPPDDVLLMACGLFLTPPAPPALPLWFPPPGWWRLQGGGPPASMGWPQGCCELEPPWWWWLWWPPPPPPPPPPDQWPPPWAPWPPPPPQPAWESDARLVSTMLLKPSRMDSESKASISRAWRSSSERIRSRRSFCSASISSSICRDKQSAEELNSSFIEWPRKSVSLVFVERIQSCLNKERLTSQMF